jgi:hypothetical protein
MPSIVSTGKTTFLSKSRYMCGRQCSKRLWQTVYDPEPREEALPGTVIGMGFEVGIKARLCWPDGVLVDTKYDEYAEAIRLTNALIADPTVRVIFEPTLVYDGVLVKVDAFERLPDGRWVLNEVKSSIKVKDEHIEDMAIQQHVVAGNGLVVAATCLVYINNQYVRNGEIVWEELFCREDITDKVNRLLSLVPERIARMHDILRLTEAPEISPSGHCKKPYPCEFWERCTLDKPKDWVFHLPYITRGQPSKFDRLDRTNIVSMKDVPKTFELTDNQQLWVDVAKSGKVFLSPQLSEILKPTIAPVSYLDFETFSSAIPIYDKTGPWQPIPFQWSLHHNDGSGSLVHDQFLAKGVTDPRREFAETLLKVSEQLPGPVLSWSSYEARIIRAMCEVFPDLAERLSTLLNRTIDLRDTAKGYFAHPDFQGSYSMKAVAPVVAPEVTYDDLDVADGNAASAAFYRVVADPTLSPEARDGLRQSLLRYCQRDTLALARVHQWLIQGMKKATDSPPLGLGPSSIMEGDKIKGGSNVTPINLADLPVMGTGRSGSNYKRGNRSR